MLEKVFEAGVIKELRVMFPGCLILKLDSGYLQGIPDRLILWGDRWATLEFKNKENAVRQPNQRYYVDLMNEMSFSAFIYPSNKEEVLSGLQQAFASSSWSARDPQS